MTTHCIGTLAEGRFFLGVTSLINSLHFAGFDGRFVVGYRSDDPFVDAFRNQLAAAELGEDKVVLLPFDHPRHFANLKAQFLKHLFVRFNSDASTYMDPDITVNCPWPWIAEWASTGPAVCADINWDLPDSHPTRHSWRHSASMLGYAADRPLDVYYNSGFLSISHRDAGFLDIWEDLIDRIGSTNNPLDGVGSIQQWRRGGRWLPFFSPNQDTLNLALMIWTDAIVSLGPDAMGFSPGYAILPHAIGPVKPWEKNFFLSTAHGFPPSGADKAFWRFVKQGPLRPFASGYTFRKVATIALCSFAGRIYARR